MARPSKYPPKLPDRVTRLAIEAPKDPAARPGAMRRIAEQTGAHPEALLNWVKKVEAGQAEIPGVQTVSDIEQIRQLEKENRELRRVNEILKTASAFSRRSPTAHFAGREVHRRASSQVGCRADLHNSHRE